MALQQNNNRTTTTEQQQQNNNRTTTEQQQNNEKVTENSDNLVPSLLRKGDQSFSLSLRVRESADARANVLSCCVDTVSILISMEDMPDTISHVECGDFPWDAF